MAQTSATKRDKKVSHQIHVLFRRAMRVDKLNLVLTLFSFAPAYFIIQVYIPLQMAYSIQAIFTRNFDEVENYITYILVAAIINVILTALGTYAIDKHGTAGAGYVQKEVFRNFLSKDYEFYSNNFTGALGADAASLREAFTNYNRLFIFELPRLLVLFIAGIGVIAMHSGLLAWVTLACIMFTGGVTFWGSAYRLRFRRQLSKASSKLGGVIGDAMTHGSTVKSFGAEDYELKRLNEPLLDWQQAQRKSWNSFIPVGSARSVLNSITICVLLFVTAKLYMDNHISIAIVALVQLYMIRMIVATLEIMELIKMHEAAMSAAYHPVATMLIRPTINDPRAPKNFPTDIKAVNFKDVRFIYSGTNNEKPAVNKFSLFVKNGQKIGLVGYSGSGKTTLTKLLLRFMDVKEGSITINNINICELSQQDLRRHIAYVPQEPMLFHRSIYENIAYGQPEASKDEVLAAAKAAYVDEFVKDLPKKYDTIVGERGVKLSGGQRQRVAIARAILKDAPILVLDEATSALDSRSEHYIQDALWHLMKDRTALVIAHRLSTIQKMDKIVVMDKGQIVQTGTHEELKDTLGIYAELWSHQSGGYIGLPSNET